MEEKKKSIKIKKIIATLLVTVGLAVAASCVVSLLSMALDTDALNVDVNDWLQDKEYVESETLSRQMLTDICRQIRYIGLQQTLEDRGELDLQKPALVVQYEDGSIVTYTMADLVAMGEDNNIYVYDEAEDGMVSYYDVTQVPVSNEFRETYVRVIWSVTDPLDAAVDLGADVWAVRQQRIDEAIAIARQGGVPENRDVILIPSVNELDQKSTEDLLLMCRWLTTIYPDVQAIPEHLLDTWQQSLDEIRAAEPYDTPVEEQESIYQWEDRLREQIYTMLESRRDDQQAKWESLYDKIEVFLCVYLEEYYDFRRTLEAPGNLRYQIVLTQGAQTEVHTDIHTNQNGGQLDSVEAWDVSYRYDSESRRIESTLPSYLREEPIHTWKSWGNCSYDNVSIAFGVDLDALNYEDCYKEGAQSYVKYRDRIFDLLGIMAVCALAVLVGMIWLIPLCGHRDGIEEIHLNLYDRLPTELGAAGICLLFVGMLLVIVGARDFSYWIMYETVAADVQNWIMIGLAAALLILVYLALWLGLYGLIRRIKAHTFWKNSLCAIVLRWCMKPLRWCWQKVRWCGSKIKAGWHALLDGGDVTWKTAAVFIGYLLINAILFLMEMNSYNGIYILLMLVFNALVGAYLVLKSAERKRVRQGVTQIASGKIDHHLPLDKLTGEERKLAEQINRIGGGLKTAVEDSLKNERMKTELITNVSHDIKTPLTSIINYVDLLKRENIEDPKIRGYIDVLDQKSQRLKTLTEDLVEASKASSGTLKLSREKIDFVELIHQTTGEFSDRFAACNLNLVTSIPETPSYIMADGRYVWRILENLYRNAEKYSMPGTRVYIEVFEKIGRVFFVMKNVSNAPLNIKAEELTERFIRGDVSRTTEGSGLGLSIAKDMTELMNGTFRVYLDGDLFRVTVSFAVISEQKTDLKDLEDNIRRRVAEEEKKVQVETADVVAESGFVQDFPIEAESQVPESAAAAASVFGKWKGKSKEKTEKKAEKKSEKKSEKKTGLTWPKVALPKGKLFGKKKNDETLLEDEDDLFDV